MSVLSEINRIAGNVEGSYSAVSEMGGEVPSSRSSDNLPDAIRSIPRGTQFSIDDTMVMQDNVLGVAKPVRGVISQEEFDSLPESDRNNGLFVIPDAVDDSPSGSTTQPFFGEIYSFEEVMIGRFIDKPLYRRCFTVTTPSRINKWTLVLEADYLSMVISHSCYIAQDVEGSYRTSIPNGVVAIGYNPGEGVAMHSSDYTWLNKEALLVLLYTKIEDQPEGA